MNQNFIQNGGIVMRKKNFRILIQMFLSFVFIIAFQLAAFGEGTEEYRLEDMEESGLADGFSDDEWGAIDIYCCPLTTHKQKRVGRQRWLAEPFILTVDSSG